ncbi:hypothetical protein FEP69_02488 [Burkholderia multivorans]|nr:hypothetical protein [Burkholderia multivorans]
MHPVLGDVHQLGTRELEHALARAQHRANPVQLRLHHVDERARREIRVAGLERVIDQPAILVPLGRVCFAGRDQRFGEAAVRLARDERIAAHPRKEVERDFREAELHALLREHVVMRERGLEPAAERAAFDHRDRDRARAEAGVDLVHAVDARARVRHQQIAPAAADRVDEEAQIAADVEQLGHERAGDPEVESQARVARDAREMDDVGDELLVEARPRFGSEHHPHDVSAFLIKSGELREFAGFIERAAGGM